MPLGSSRTMFSMTLHSYAILVASAALVLLHVPAFAMKVGDDYSLTYVWLLPGEFSSGNVTLLVNPGLLLIVEGHGSVSSIVKDAFERYSRIIFQHNNAFGISDAFRRRTFGFDINKLKVIVHSKDDGANTVNGALRGFETFSQLCAFDFGAETVLVKSAPWYIKDKPRFTYRGLLIPRGTINQLKLSKM